MSKSAITSEHVEAYLGELQPARDEVLLNMEDYAQQHDIPIVGPVAGRLLATIAKIHRSKRILEAGTAIGYSALWFAQATEAWGGRVTTIERDPEMAERARQNLGDAGVIDRVELHVGDALETLERLEGPFDLCFLDQAKEQYRPFLERALAKLGPGGVVLADNVLRKGEVAKRRGGDEMVRSMREFNTFVMEHPELDAVIVPLRDGILVGVRR